MIGFFHISQSRRRTHLAIRSVGAIGTHAHGNTHDNDGKYGNEESGAGPSPGGGRWTGAIDDHVAFEVVLVFFFIGKLKFIIIDTI